MSTPPTEPRPGTIPPPRAADVLADQLFGNTDHPTMRTGTTLYLVGDFGSDAVLDIRCVCLSESDAQRVVTLQPSYLSPEIREIELVRFAR